jgi:hypothetical protein
MNLMAQRAIKNVKKLEFHLFEQGVHMQLHPDEFASQVMELRIACIRLSIKHGAHTVGANLQ